MLVCSWPVPNASTGANGCLTDIVSYLEDFYNFSQLIRWRGESGLKLWASEWMVRKAHSLSDFLWLLCLWLHQKQIWHSGCLWHRSSDNISLYLVSLCSSLEIVSWCNLQHLQMCFVLMERKAKPREYTFQLVHPHNFKETRNNVLCLFPPFSFYLNYLHALGVKILCRNWFFSGNFWHGLIYTFASAGNIWCFKISSRHYCDIKKETDFPYGMSS